MVPRTAPVLSVGHIYAPRVSVREQAALLVERLRRHRTSTFRSLTSDCPDTLHVVARFLGLLELYREGAVAFEQVDALGELHVRWTGSDEGEVDVDDEFDDETGQQDGEEGAAATPAADRTIDLTTRPQAGAGSVDVTEHEEDEQ